MPELTSYVVSRGDTLSRIAARFSVTAAALVDANKTTYPTLVSNPNAISVGWKLQLPPPGDLPNDEILMVGMNAGSSYEAQVLRTKARLIFVSDAFANDVAEVPGGRRYDVTTQAGCETFANSLGLQPDQSQKIAEAIEQAGSDARDEIALLAWYWADAERGKVIPSRLVLSGHSAGSGIWGDDNGYLALSTLGRLADAMPAAADRIEDLHISGCYSGGQVTMELYRAIFPRVKTIWAYADSAPGSYSGAEAHLRLWEEATRGNRTDLDRQLAAHTRKGENVAVWTVQSGYQDGQPPRPLSSVQADVTSREPVYQRFFTGADVADSPQEGPLREYYNYVQRLVQHPDLSAAERPRWETRRDQTIRLLYYSKNVTPRFATHYGTQVGAAYQLLLQSPPDLASLSRKDLATQLAWLEQKGATASTAQSTLRTAHSLLRDGLWELDPALVPPAWI